MSRLSDRATGHQLGLGITAHAGEFSTANIEVALKTRGLTRIGHAVHETSDPRWLDLTNQRRITVGCCLSCNVVLGAVETLDGHPIR